MFPAFVFWLELGRSFIGDRSHTTMSSPVAAVVAGALVVEMDEKTSANATMERKSG